MEVSQRLGWVKLHRKLLDHPRFTDGDWLKVKLALLLLATHKPYQAIFGGTKITLQPGQLITSQKSLSTLTKVQGSKIERILRVMKTDNQIDNLGSNRNRLITVKNWIQYQGDDKQNEKQMTTHRQTSDNKQELRELREGSFLPAGGENGARAPSLGAGEEKPPLTGGQAGTGTSPRTTPKQSRQAKPREPDPIWNTLCEVFGMKPATARDQKRIGAVVRDLKAKGASPENIRLVYGRMEKEEWSPFSPEGLVKWFDQLSKSQPAPHSTVAPVHIPGFR